jgi:hypothetical protein
VDLENAEKTLSEESIDEMSERQSESETGVLPVDGWEDVTMGDKKHKKEVISRVNRGKRY